MFAQSVLTLLANNGHNDTKAKCVKQGSMKISSDGKITITKKTIPNLPAEMISKILGQATEMLKPKVPTMAERVASYAYRLVERDAITKEFVVSVAEIKKHLKKHGCANSDMTDAFSVRGKHGRWGWCMRAICSKFPCISQRVVINQTKTGLTRFNQKNAEPIHWNWSSKQKCLGPMLCSWIADIITEGELVSAIGGGVHSLHHNDRKAGSGWCPFTFQYGRGTMKAETAHFNAPDQKEDAEGITSYWLYWTNKPTTQPPLNLTDCDTPNADEVACAQRWKYPAKSNTAFNIGIADFK